MFKPKETNFIQAEQFAIHLFEFSMTFLNLDNLLTEYINKIDFLIIFAIIQLAY